MKEGIIGGILIIGLRNKTDGEREFKRLAEIGKTLKTLFCSALA